MTQLYTSLADVKLAMAHGEPPVYEPLTLAREWRRRLDPAHVLGLGALLEDEDRGIKCPFRDCDDWHQSLANHVFLAHGVRATELKQALGLPTTVALVSSAYHEKLSAIQRQIVADGRSGIVRAQAARRKTDRRMGAAARRKLYGQKYTAGHSTAARNWRMACRTQLQRQLEKVAGEHWAVDLTRANADVLLGPATVKKISRAFGSWNRAKIAANLDVRWRYAFRLDLDTVVKALVNFRRENGRWPSSEEVQRGHQAPALPSYNPIRRVTRSRSWAQALRVVQRHAERHGHLRLVA